MAQTKHAASKNLPPKRKRLVKSDDDLDGYVSDSQVAAPPAKKPAMTTSAAPTPAFDPAIAMMDPSLLADHFAKAVKRHDKDTSTALELEEKYLSSAAFMDTTAFSQPRVRGELPAFLERFAGTKDELTDAAEETASPHTVIITASGIRAADIARVLRVFRTVDNAVAKLFAKHMKLKETVNYVRKTKIGFGVGTPHRLGELLESESLKIAALKRIVIDGSYIDEKKRGLWSMKEMFDPLLGLLTREDMKERYESGETRILVF